MAVAVAIGTVVIALLGVLVFGLLRSHAEILEKLRQLEGGTVPHGGDPAAPRPRARRPAFDVVGVTLAGEAVKIGVVGARHPTLVAFLSSGCYTCLDFWSTFRAKRRLSIPGDARLVVVTKGTAEESLSRLRELAPETVTVVLSTAAWTDYDVPVAPYFVYVDGPAGEVVAEGGARTWDEVAEMWSRAVDRDAAGSARRGRASGRARAAQADQELLDAGIHPGHPSLYPSPGED